MRAVWREAVVSAAVVAAIVGAVDLGFRAIVPSLSANSRTLAAAPARAEAIRGYADGPTVLVLGNSISGEGIAADRLQNALRAADVAALVVHQPADTTVARDWYYELTNQFFAHGAVPDFVVLPVGDAHPLTRVNERTEDLLFSFLRWHDLPQLFRISEQAAHDRAIASGRDPTPRTELFEDRAGVALAKGLTLYGFRGRLQKRVLVTAVPRYEELRLAMRDANTSTATGEDAVSADPTWARLLAEAARAAGTRVIVVAMPTEPIEGQLPAEDRALADENGWTVLEPAATVTWTREDRPDGLHLTPEARDRLTDLLAPALVDAIRAASPPPTP